MTSLDAPLQCDPKALGAAWTVLPSWLPVPGMGVLAVNSFLYAGKEPLLVDSGLAALSDAFMEAMGKSIDPAELKWVWLSHTDADHIGNLKRVLELAPQATVVTNFLGAGKIGLLGGYDAERVRILAPGEIFEASGLRLHQVRPPYYDAPETMGFFDETNRTLFCADAFGALLPEPVESLEEVDRAALRDGLVGWSAIDAPWLAQTAPAALDGALRALRDLTPETVMSGHLPAFGDIESLSRHIAQAYCGGATGDVTQEAVQAVEAAMA